MAKYKATKFGISSERTKERGSARPRGKFDSIFVQGVTRYTPKQGLNSFRVVCDEDAPYWGEILWVHERIGIKNSSYLCPVKMGRSDQCPMCDAQADALRDGDKDEAGALEAKERTAAYVLDRSDEKAGLKVYDMSWSRDNEINIAAETSKGVIIFSHPDSGFDIRIHRSGTGLKTRYTGLQIERDSTPLHESQRVQDALLDEVRRQPISSLLKFYDTKYLTDILTGKIEEKDEEDEAAPRTGDGKARGGRREEVDKPLRSRTPDRRTYDEEGDEEEDDGRTARRGGGNARDSEEERPSSRRDRGRPSYDDSEEETPRRASRAAAEEDEEEVTPQRTTRRVVEREEDDPPTRRTARRGSRDEEPDDPEPEAVARANRRAAREREEEGEAEEAEAGRWRRGRDADEENEERATRGGRTRSRDAEDEGERSGKRTTRKRLADDEPASRRRRPVDDEDVEEEEEVEEEETPRRARR